MTRLCTETGNDLPLYNEPPLKRSNDCSITISNHTPPLLYIKSERSNELVDSYEDKIALMRLFRGSNDQCSWISLLFKATLISNAAMVFGMKTSSTVSVL